MSDGKHFICSACGDHCVSEWTEEEASSEYERNFAGSKYEREPMESASVLCTECYERFWKWAEVNAPELKRINREDLS